LIIRTTMVWKLDHDRHRQILGQRPRPPACSGAIRDPAAEEHGAQWGNVADKSCVVKLRAAAKAMLKSYDGACMEVATHCRITSPVWPVRKTR
jgi:hypothetical protein